MVPIRVISESLGANVDWNEETKTVTVENDENKIELTIGSKTDTANRNYTYFYFWNIFHNYFLLLIF